MRLDVKERCENELTLSIISSNYQIIILFFSKFTSDINLLWLF